MLLYECTLSDYALDGPGNAPHAIWLDILPNSPKYVYDSLGGIIQLFDDSTAHITGRVINITDSTWQWDVDMWMFRPVDYPTWIAGGGMIKNDIADPAVIAANQANWTFWELDSTRSILTGVPGTFFDLDTLRITHRPANLSVGFQLGIGGNARNGNFGLGGWFYYDGAYSGHGDINVDLGCDTPACDIFIDSAVTQCVSDSTYELVVSFTGSNVLYQLYTTLGDTLGPIIPGTYVLGPYSDTDSVGLVIKDLLLTNCADTLALQGADCAPPPVCDLVLDSASSECLTDSTFKVVLTISGSSTYDLSDDLGLYSASGPAGTYEFGP